MTTTSAVPQVKAQLEARLALALPDVQVSYGFPGDTIERETVWLGEVRGSNELVLMAPGRVQRDEDFELSLVFDAQALGGTPKEAELRAFELFAALEDILAGDPSLQGLISTGIWLSDFSAGAYLNPDGAVARIEVKAHFRTRLF